MSSPSGILPLFLIIALGGCAEGGTGPVRGTPHVGGVAPSPAP